MLDLAIIGAGPYGLSLAAHAKESGIKHKVFGFPMDFWKTKNPPNMFIRTKLKHTNLIDPESSFTLKKYEQEKGLNLEYPINRLTFADYGVWFIEKVGIDIIQDLVIEINYANEFFNIKTENNDFFQAKRIIVGVGVSYSKYIPKKICNQSHKLVSHSSDHTDYKKFEKKHVLVLGGGQSAWESAALLHENNAEVVLAYRRNKRLTPEKDLNKQQLEIADQFYSLSEPEKIKMKEKFEKPTVSEFLVHLVKGKVVEKPNSFVKDIQEINNSRQIKVVFNDDESNVFDHVIAATGYRYSVENITFLYPLIDKLKVNSVGEPILSENFESNLKNLYFVGPASSYSFGPTFRFISGIKMTCDTLINYIK